MSPLSQVGLLPPLFEAIREALNAAREERS